MEYQVKEGTEVLCIPSYAPCRTLSDAFSPTVIPYIVHHWKNYLLVVLLNISEEDLGEVAGHILGAPSAET
jgi:hypothetical protein